MRTGRQLRSSKEDFTDDCIDKIWSKLEIESNTWIEKTLPNIAEAVTDAKIQEIITVCDDKYVSSETFRLSLADNISFDSESGQ